MRNNAIVIDLKNNIVLLLECCPKSRWLTLPTLGSNSNKPQYLFILHQVISELNDFKKMFYRLNKHKLNHNTNVD